jgi:hypothetical protein
MFVICYLDYSKRCRLSRFGQLFKAVSINLDPSLVNTPLTGHPSISTEHSNHNRAAAVCYLQSWP